VTIKHHLLVSVLYVLALLASLALAATACGGETAFADTVAAQPAGPSAELCPFSPGWNLVTLNGTPADLPPCVAVAWAYDGATDEWHFWGRDNAPYWNDLERFALGRGYWLYVGGRQ
jgi:hypothetical protein